MKSFTIGEINELISAVRRLYEGALPPEELAQRQREIDERESARKAVHEAKMAALKDAHALAAAGEDYQHKLKERGLLELALIAMHGLTNINHVSVYCHRDECQKATAHLAGKALPIGDELMNPSLPFEGCQCFIYSDDHPFCMCMYQEVFDDEV